MRRFAFILPLILVALLATGALAQKTKRNGTRNMPDTTTSRQTQTDTMDGSMAVDTMDGAMDSARAGGSGCMCMMGHMMSPMMEKQMLLGRDGGVVILLGNRLIKYDEKLNLVKDVEIQVNIEEMCRKMDELMSRCPTMHKKKGMMGPSGTPSR